MDAAPSAVAEKNATPILVMELPAAAPATLALEQRHALKARLSRPTLFLNAAPLLITDVDGVLAAAHGATVTVPILDHRQRSHR